MVKMIVKGVTKAIAIVVAIITLLVGVGIGYVVASYMAPAAPVTPTAGLTGEVPIGVLLPLSGPLATLGEPNRPALLIAADEINNLLAKSGANWRIKLYIEDTETKPEIALEKLMSLHAKGIKVVIGPMGSGEVLKIKEYADSNKILIISQSSTSPMLAIKGDYIYRFVPNDLYQGVIGPKFAKKLGVTHMFLVYLANPWGDGLAEVSEKTAKELGITVSGKFRIAEGATDYSAEVSSLAAEVNKLVEQGIPPEKIMIHIITYGEATTFMLSAREYDVLWKVKWFGSDGTAYEGTLIDEVKTAEFASSVRFVSPIFTPTKTARYQEVMDKIVSQLGRTAPPYAFNAYDALWVVALCLMATDKYDADAIIAVMPSILKNYYGASGYIVLDETGDRIAVDYELTEILAKDGTYEWAVTGMYYGTTGEIVWK
jgi:branched-chain amino acid transport system substrate-binding protein